MSTMKASMFWMAVFTQAWGAKYQSLMKLNAGAADDHEEQKECVVVSGTYFCTLDGNKEYQFALTEACKGVMSEEIEYTVAGNTLTLVGKGLTATVDAAGNFDFGSAGMCRNVATVAMAVAAPVTPCTTTDTQLHHAGYIYRTLAGAPVDGTGKDSNQEYNYFPMPAGFEVAPDGGEVASTVIAGHRWDNWRICTQTRCYAGENYGGTAGTDRTDQGIQSPAWERNANGEYRLIAHTHSWCRLLIRSSCSAPAPPPPASPANLKFSTTAEACAWCSFYRKDCKCMCYADGSGGVMQYCVSPKPPVHGSGGIAAVNDWTNGTECA